MRETHLAEVAPEAISALAPPMAGLRCFEADAVVATWALRVPHRPDAGVAQPAARDLLRGASAVAVARARAVASASARAVPRARAVLWAVGGGLWDVGLPGRPDTIVAVRWRFVPGLPAAGWDVSRLPGVRRLPWLVEVLAEGAVAVPVAIGLRRERGVPFAGQRLGARVDWVLCVCGG